MASAENIEKCCGCLVWARDEVQGNERFLSNLPWPEGYNPGRGWVCLSMQVSLKFYFGPIRAKRMKSGSFSQRSHLLNYKSQVILDECSLLESSSRFFRGKRKGEVAKNFNSLIVVLLD